MLFWFVATAIATIWIVFRDPRFDYRPLIVGALLPDVVDIWFGRAAALHSAVVAMTGVVVVMLATIGRRAQRRMMLAVPIGVLLHLVFDGAFTDPEVFWWPLGGTFADTDLPVVSRGWWNLVLEAAGAAILLVGGRRFGLQDRRRRRRFWASGQLSDR